jgi:hypothetical protein
MAGRFGKGMTSLANKAMKLTVAFGARSSSPIR